MTISRQQASRLGWRRSRCSSPLPRPRICSARTSPPPSTRSRAPSSTGSLVARDRVRRRPSPARSAPGAPRSRAAGGRICPRAGRREPRRRLDGQLVRAGEARRRREDRAVLARDRRARPHLDGGRRLRRARRRALADARGLLVVASADRRDAAVARVRALRRSSRRSRRRRALGPPAPAPADRAGARRGSPRSSARRARSPRSLGWTAGMVLARLGATMAVAAALGLPHPVLAALLILPALDVAVGVPAHARHRSASAAARSPSRSRAAASA